MTLPDFFKILSPNSEIIDYLKRYFYQIIGIYFPSTILAFYIFLFWYIGPNNDPITYYSIFSAIDSNGNFADGWPKIIADNIYKISTYGQHIDILEVILFVVNFLSHFTVMKIKSTTSGCY